ncbi:MAG: sialate O-acetylesterase, partial [Hymenobacter sp.]|nr:sialate O-acetylesterase [Hymenobacter sp.]
AEANPKVRIGLVPCAVGGTSIDKWTPGTYDEATKTHPYDDAAARIAVAMRGGVVRGMLWHQGESDTRPDATAAYLSKLAGLIGRIRALTGQPALPVVVGELGRFREANRPFNAQLPQVLPLVPPAALVTAEELTDKGDQLHFDAASADELGRRYATQMLALERAASKVKTRAGLKVKTREN